jgi:hypothetical protein
MKWNRTKEIQPKSHHETSANLLIKFRVTTIQNGFSKHSIYKWY